MLQLLDIAAAKGAELVVFPECAFTTFFPRYLFTNQEELESYFEDDFGGNSIAASKNVKRSSTGPIASRSISGLDMVSGLPKADTSIPRYITQDGWEGF